MCGHCQPLLRMRRLSHTHIAAPLLLPQVPAAQREQRLRACQQAVVSGVLLSWPAILLLVCMRCSISLTTPHSVVNLHPLLLPLVNAWQVCGPGGRAP
jgi:hypothetical protein